MIFTAALLATRCRRAAATSSPPGQAQHPLRAEEPGAARTAGHGAGAKEAGVLGDAKEMAQSMAFFSPMFGE